MSRLPVAQVLKKRKLPNGLFEVYLDEADNWQHGRVFAGNLSEIQAQHVIDVVAAMAEFRPVPPKPAGYEGGADAQS